MKSKRGHKKCRKTKRRQGVKTKKRAQKGGEVTILRSLPQKGQINLLQQACQDPDNCLMLGSYDDYVKTHFNGFSDLSQIDIKSVKRIGSDSVNGFVLELPFVKDGFCAYTILKSAVDAFSDNLFYEFFVGKYFINKFTKKVPCFVETYDLYEFKDEKQHDFIMRRLAKKEFFANLWSMNELGIRRKETNPTFHKEDLDDDFEQSCLINKRLCILIQHFNNVRSIHEMRTTYFEQFKSDTFSSIYQVYYALAMLKDKFTHYDLHAGNVLVYKPFDGKSYIRMRYHYGGDGKKTVEFNTEYIVKIIDYGRCFVDNNGVTTNDIMDKICKLRGCDPKCGYNFGFSVLQGSKDTLNTLAIDGLDPTKLNNSHDLRFVKETFKSDFLTSMLPSKALPSINIHYRHSHSTPHAIGNGSIGEIRSVMDMHEYLRQHVMDHPITKERNAKKYDSSWTEAATMDVYDDGRDYVFTLLP